MLCCVASPRSGDGRRHGGLLSVKGRRVLIFNRGRLYLEPAASPSPWWTAQRRSRPAPLWRKAVGGNRTSLSLPDRISLQMSFKTRRAVFRACVFVCARVCVLVSTISNLRVFLLRETCIASHHALHLNLQARRRAFRYNAAPQKCKAHTLKHLFIKTTVVVLTGVDPEFLVLYFSTFLKHLFQRLPVYDAVSSIGEVQIGTIACSTMSITAQLLFIQDKHVPPPFRLQTTDTRHILFLYMHLPLKMQSESESTKIRHAANQEINLNAFSF